MLTFSLEGKTPGMRQRDRQKMSDTFHGAGMVVPYDKKTLVRGGAEAGRSNPFCNVWHLKGTGTARAVDPDLLGSAFILRNFEEKTEKGKEITSNCKFIEKNEEQ